MLSSEAATEIRAGTSSPRLLVSGKALSAISIPEARASAGRPSPVTGARSGIPATPGIQTREEEKHICLTRLRASMPRSLPQAGARERDNIEVRERNLLLREPDRDIYQRIKNP